MFEVKLYVDNEKKTLIVSAKIDKNTIESIRSLVESYSYEYYPDFKVIREAIGGHLSRYFILDNETQERFIAEVT